MSGDGHGFRAFVSPSRLRVPRLSSGLVHRPRLVGAGIGQRPVSLVSGPAGSGKSILVADWATQRVADGEPVAWLSVEDRDDRPFEFWSAIIEALIAAGPTATARRLDSLSPPQQGFEPRFIAALAEPIAAEPTSRWLVLDDAQRLHSPDVIAGLDIVLADPPGGLRIVLIARTDPAVAVHRLRLHGELQEVRPAELAFTEPEAAALLARLGTPLTEPDLSRLVARTEGWAAGLRLAAVSLAAAADAAAFISAFEVDQGAVADYLFAEIVRHLPADLYEFLLATCIPEQLPLELAAELSGRADAGRLLDQVCRANALVVQSGETSYRYHSLLRGYLHSALTRADIAAPGRQHAATARWLDRHDQPAVALDHALHAGDDELLATLLRRHGLRLILSGQAALVCDTVAAADSWREDRSVAIVAALAALDVADIARADGWLAVVDKQDRPADPRLGAMWASAIAQRALVGGDVAAAMRDTDLLQQQLTGDGDVDLIALACRAPARMRSGDYGGATADLQRALALARAGHYDQFVLGTLSQLSGMAGAACDLGAAGEWAAQAIAFAKPRGWVDSPRLAYAYLLAAWTAFQTGDQGGQAGYAELGMRSLEGVTNVEVELGVRSMYTLARFESRAGAERRAAAKSFHALWQSSAADQVSPALSGHASPQEIRLALAVGEHRWAAEAVERVERQLPDSAEAATVRAQLIVGIGSGRSGEALRLLQPVLRGALVVHLPTTVVAAEIMTAVLEQRAGSPIRAFDALERALDWAAPRNYRRPFIDSRTELQPLLIAHQGRFGPAEQFVAELLADWARRDADPHVLPAPLSPRELQVLRDLPSRLSMREIADLRGLSVNTVKTHLASVYRKLGVDGRRAAVEEARTRGLI